MSFENGFVSNKKEAGIYTMALVNEPLGCGATAAASGRPAFLEPFIDMEKLKHWKQLDDGEKRAKIKKGANKYAFDYMKLHAGEFVRIKDVQEYCSQQHKLKTGCVLGDPPRAFEILRKDKLPLEWEEKKIGNEKYVKFAPHKKLEHTEAVIQNHAHKADGFTKQIISSKMETFGYKCAITGIPVADGGLAADHFIPKEKGGKSEPENCVILNKILNEKKNNTMPVEWFTTSLLTNFMNVAVQAGIDKEEMKSQLIDFIKHFE
jgi:5-methylcytosine-specific restriction endonuclease McrA